ncbi:hypothetical protein OBBRIDRAFT_778769 [Obba rivulosa]|uniref:Heterokaryon incompatibility domain-containing protein n=1 Tax=Obba rivulosa TaxID=1052685 RepID=A0A8E2DJQ2_9APHY|nr:hypothetical protein OBBRIDRAFT_778769 [Obba rivulosa]
MSKPILEITLDFPARPATLPVLDISPAATPCRFRLIDCVKYLRHRTLSICEFTEFPVPNCAYTAISYVWRGNSVDDESTLGPVFSVAGAEDGDPVSVNVLTHACTAALREKTNYIWLDRLCIIQTSKDDKQWQIRRMFEIYQRCALCLVFPGGIQRLVHIHEHTTWINRGWTLQEALAPPRVDVIHAWNLGGGMFYGAFRGYITELVPGESAMTPLRTMLSLNNFGLTNFFPTNATIRHVTFHAELFGPHDSDSSGTQTVAEQTTRAVVFMLKEALTEGTFDERAPAIWRSALFRTSSRPVDMVFSIMGLFGVTLDVRRFSRDDRLRATIALMQEILRQGGRASWLGLAPYLPVNPMLSAIPIFPRTRVEGDVLLEVDRESGIRPTPQHLRSALLDTRRIRMPTGSMDDAGYLTISRNAIRVYPQLDPQATFLNETDDFRWETYSASLPRHRLNFRAIDHTGWRFYEDMDAVHDSPTAFAVLLGWFNKFSEQGVWDGPRHIAALLIKEHAPDKFHVNSYFELPENLELWVEGWDEHTFRIGGPLAASHS